MDTLAEDLQIMIVLDHLSDTEIEKFQDVSEYPIEDNKHYLMVQQSWMQDCWYFLGLKLNRQPTDLEFIDSWMEHNCSQRFRVYYILQYTLNTRKDMKITFFEWVSQCCVELGEPIEYGVNMMPVNDPCWYFAYDDGQTPQEAVNEYKLKQKVNSEK